MMTSTRPVVELDGKYTQGQVARLLGIDRHTVKNYERDGLLPFRTRKAGKRAVTTGADIMRLWTTCYI